MDHQGVHRHVLLRRLAAAQFGTQRLSLKRRDVAALVHEIQECFVDLGLGIWHSARLAPKVITIEPEGS